MNQYTLRNVPEAVDRALRERAHRGHKSLNKQRFLAEPGVDALYPSDATTYHCKTSVSYRITPAF